MDRFSFERGPFQRITRGCFQRITRSRFQRITRSGLTVLLIVAGLLLSAGCRASGPSSTGLEPVRPPAGLTLEPVLAKKVEAQIASVVKRPTDPEAHGTLAMIYEANAVWDLATGAYENAATLAPERPEWLYHAATCDMRTGDSSGAEARLKDLAIRFPQFAPARHRLGLALLDAGDLAGAERELLAVHRLGPSIAEANAALAQLRNVEGRFAEALPYAQKAVALDPRSQRARFMRGQSLRGLGRDSEARGDLTAGAVSGTLLDAIDRRLGNFSVGVSVHVDRGANLIDAGRFDEAIRVLRAGLEDRPDHPSLLTNLAVAYQKSGKQREALEILEKLYRDDPNDLPILLNLSETLWASREYPRGLEVASVAVDQHPESGLAHFAKGRILFALNRVDEGVAACVTAGSLEPQNSEIQSAIGEGYFVQRDLERSAEHFQRSVELDPSSFAHRTNLCTVLQGLERWDQADVILAELIRVAPTHPKVQVLEERAASRKIAPPSTPLTPPTASPP